MKRDFKEALSHRRTYYSIDDNSPIADREIEDILRFALTHVPSAFNSKTTRMVLMLGKQHDRLWEIVLDTLRGLVGGESFKSSEAKVRGAFAAGYGTILFYEDTDAVKDLQDSFASYAEKFPQWSQHTAGMHQLAVWTMLEDAGFGASLQHYNPLIDAAVAKEWEIPTSWSLIAQMPFGVPLQEPGPKAPFDPDTHLKIFK